MALILLAYIAMWMALFVHLKSALARSVLLAATEQLELLQQSSNLKATSHLTSTDRHNTIIALLFGHLPPQSLASLIIVTRLTHCMLQVTECA